VETIGIRELRTHLSRQLLRMRAGVRLVVTDRGRSIATISPVAAPDNVDWAHQLVAEGLPDGTVASRRDSRAPCRSEAGALPRLSLRTAGDVVSRHQQPRRVVGRRLAGEWLSVANDYDPNL